MRYLILKPRTDTFDPRYEVVKDTAHLHDTLPPIADCATEREAAATVRRALPNAMGMPFPMKIGSGHTVLLGFVEDPGVQVDPDDDVPFVLFVQPVAEAERDRNLIAKALAAQDRVFDSQLWKLKPVKPALGKTVPIEWRTSELDAPAFLDAKIGYENGRLVIYAEMGEHTMSLTFRTPNLVLEEREPEVPIVVPSGARDIVAG